MATIPTLLFLNKQDLELIHSPSELPALLNWPGEPAYLSGSGKTGDGINELWQWLVRVTGLEE